MRRSNYGKTYGYLLTENRQCPPFLKRYIWRTGKKLDIMKMEQVAQVLEGTHDFTSFRGNNSVPSDPVRKINEIRIVKTGELYRIYVTGEGFLYHMVRNIAGVLVDAGIGAVTPKEVQHILEENWASQLRRKGCVFLKCISNQSPKKALIGLCKNRFIHGLGKSHRIMIHLPCKMTTFPYKETSFFIERFLEIRCLLCFSKRIGKCKKGYHLLFDLSHSLSDKFIAVVTEYIV